MSDVDARVLLVLPNLYIGGSQESVRTLARHLATQGCMPVVCALFDGGPLMNDLLRQGTPVEVLSLARHRFVDFPRFVADMARIWRAVGNVIKKYDINVVQTYVLGIQHFLVLAVARVLGVPVVVLNFRNERFLPAGQEGRLRIQFHRLAYRLARHWASDYVAVSSQVQRALTRCLGLSDEDVTVICNGVDVDRYRQSGDRDGMREQLGLDHCAILLTTIATLKAQKGHRYLIEAANVVVRREPKVHFLLAGDGELRLELEAQAKTCGLSDNVHFLGNRRDVVEILNASDIFVLPSLWEGLSMALLEAMAAAKPIVATNVSGTDEVMVDGETGLLVPPGDSGLLARAIDELISDPNRARAMGKAAQQRVKQRFSTETQASQYLALYDRLLREV